jgi:hypothetical protein
MKDVQAEALDELRQFLAGIGLSTRAKRTLEVWARASNLLERLAKEKSAVLNKDFVAYLQVRINYCSRLEFEDGHLRIQCFALVMPFLLLLACSLAGLGFSTLAAAAYQRFGWCFLVGSVWLSILVIVRGVKFTQQHFWIRLDTALGPPDMDKLPPDTYPAEGTQ